MAHRRTGPGERWPVTRTDEPAVRGRSESVAEDSNGPGVHEGVTR